MSNLLKSTASNLSSIATWMMIKGIIINHNASSYSEKNKHCLKPRLRHFSTAAWENQELYQKKKLSVYANQHIKRIKTSDYSFLMIDNAIIQCYYVFGDDSLIWQKMAFYQSPFSKSYDLNPERYGEHVDSEEPYPIEEQGETVTCLRFDYEPNNFVECLHPKSHLHLGSFRNCRIPVISPLKLTTFFSFIMKNFYFSEYDNFRKYLQVNEGRYRTEVNFEQTVTEEEAKDLHMSLNVS